ncbi:MAG: hypothetical protein H6611_09735 [Ignavibacteriales bacterium]|nr:hypothetical protein [Ignavibacteriales bacterium]
MIDKIKLLYEKVRSSMFSYEEVNKLINSIDDKNIVTVKVKERLNEYSNTVLADMLIFSDVLYQLLEAGDNDEMRLLLDGLSGGDDEL